jgi:putative transposase
MGTSPEDDDRRKSRLRRLDVLFPRNPIFFVTACTFERRAILRLEALHGAFVDFAQKAGGMGHWIGPYVLMPDHLHLFVAPADTAVDGLSRWVKSMKNALSKKWRNLGIASPHWQKGFFDHVLRSDESVAKKWHYIRENPVRAGLVTRWEDDPFQGQIHPM